MNIVKQKVIEYLDQFLKDLKADNTNLTEEQVMDLYKFFGGTYLSKEQSCSYLNISSAKFDNLIRDGKLKGKKIRGFKEIFYIKSDLDNCMKG